MAGSRQSIAWAFARRAYNRMIRFARDLGKCRDLRISTGIHPSDRTMSQLCRSLRIELASARNEMLVDSLFALGSDITSVGRPKCHCHVLAIAADSGLGGKI